MTGFAGLLVKLKYFQIGVLWYNRNEELVIGLVGG